MALISTLYDDFAWPALDAARWGAAAASASATTTNNILNISTFAASSASYTLTSTQTYTFTGSSIYAQFTHSTNLTTGSTAHVFSFDVKEPANLTMIRMYLSGGLLFGQNIVAGGSTVTTNLGSYVAATMSYWRIRHNAADNTVYAATSPDAITWTETDITGGLSIGWHPNAKAQFQLTNNTAATSAFTTVDRINGGPPLSVTASAARMTITRPTPTTTVTGPIVASAPRTMLQRGTTGSVATNTKVNMAGPASNVRMTIRTIKRESELLSGDVLANRPSTGLLWPPAGAWARR